MIKLRKGTQQWAVYSLLMPHQAMRTDKLQSLVKFDKAALSSTLTALRRKGLAEYKGSAHQEGGLLWKRHPMDKPLFPPQKDIAPRKAGSSQQVEKYTDIADRIADDLRKLRWIIKQQTKQLELYEEIKHKLLGDV